MEPKHAPKHNVTNDITGLSKLVAQRADDELWGRIHRAVTQVRDLVGPAEWIDIEGYTNAILFDEEPVTKGHKARVFIRAILDHLTTAIFDGQKEDNRQRAYREFVRKFDEMREAVAEIKDRQAEED